MLDIIEMHLKLLFDLDNLIADMEEPSYKKIGFQLEEEAGLVLIQKRNDLLKKLPKEIAQAYEILKKRYRPGRKRILSRLLSKTTNSVVSAQPGNRHVPELRQNLVLAKERMKRRPLLLQR
jgi:hypothetical protein